MKLKKKVFPLLLSLIITPCLFAQKISYTYDSAGNRISRQYVVELRSATVPKAEGIDSTSVETFLDDLSVSVYPNPTKGALAVKVTNVPNTIDSNLFTIQIKTAPDANGYSYVVGGTISITNL